MFCFQCEQTSHGTGCTDLGVCGKDAPTAALQDLLIHVCKGISMYASRASKLGARNGDVDKFVVDGLFSTVTNVNFHQGRLQAMLTEAANVREQAKSLYLNACSLHGVKPEELSGPATWIASENIDELILQGYRVSINGRTARLGADIAGLQELLTYGLKGAAAYYHHAIRLGIEDIGVYAGIHEGLSILTKEDATAQELLGASLKCGELNFKIMELLDTANTSAYGHPVPTAVRVEPVAGKSILVSGHDLKDLEDVLKQTEGKGINVYTHGEMLPAHGYPGLKKYAHLVGNYGGAWQHQAEEFDKFPGAVLMTTNCIQKPRATYIERIFTSGLVAWPGVRHLGDGDYSALIEAALEAPGFDVDAPEAYVTVGFGHNTVLGVADVVIDAVKSGAIRHFFLIGGCDGARPGRNYFQHMAESVPEDCVILTLGCGKYRFVKEDFGTIGGLPRLLDIGQCNDSYSAVKIAVALAGAFGCGVNELPLSLIISWYEQKAVAVLLTLLALGVKNIRLGPSLPAFVTPSVLAILSDTFNLMPTGTVEGDLQAILG